MDETGYALDAHYNYLNETILMSFNNMLRIDLSEEFLLSTNSIYPMEK